MKKSLIIAAIALLCFALTACCGTKDAPAPEATDTPAASGAALLKAGDFLYRNMGSESMANILTTPPERIYIRIDHGGAEETASVSDPETIKKLVDAFVQVTIQDDKALFTTDNYNGVTFVFSEENNVSLSLNLKSYERMTDGSRTLYTLANFDPFWNLINELAEPEQE